MNVERESGYDRVRSNLDSIISSLKATPGAREALTVQFNMEKWFPLTESPTEYELVILALTRIKQDPSQYDIFLTMLREIEGMDLIVKMLYDRGQRPPVLMEPTSSPAMASTAATDEIPPENILAPPPKRVAVEPQGQVSPCQSKPETSSSIHSMGGNESNVAVVQEEAAQLQDQFVTVLIHTKICLTKKEAEFLGDFKVTLTTLPLSKRHHHLLFLEREKGRIKAATDVDEILDVLEPYWNYSDYVLLERIIKEFGTNGLQEEMKKYIADLEQFEMKTTVKDYDAARLSKTNIPEYFVKVAIEQDKDPTIYTLYEVRQLQNEVVNQSAVSAFALFRVQVTPSSVNIILAFPPEAYADLSKVFDWEFRERHNIVLIEFSKPVESSDVTTAEKGMSGDKWTIETFGEVHHVGEHTEELETTVPGYIPSAAMASELGEQWSSLPAGATAYFSHAALCLDQPTESPLDIDDLFEVMSEVFHVAHHWRDIGQALGLRDHVLYSLEHRYGVRHCLQETLIHWLRRDYDTTRYGQPSWQMLVAAIADPAGGNNRALAERIAARHNVQVGRF